MRTRPLGLAIAPNALTASGEEERETETATFRTWLVSLNEPIERELWRFILRKEVIQPQVPLRLPCYDFTPVADPTVVACLPCGLAQRLRVKPTPMV